MFREHSFLKVISGKQRGLLAAAARSGLSLLEPAYAGVTRARNQLFDRGIKARHDLGRPAISVGNLTTGGTGKTPVVQWIARTLIARGATPAVLLRGYKSADGVSDEAELYRQIAGLTVEADPDRVAAAGRVLARAPLTSVFVLDDGFQHRRVRRDLDVVLIDATNPFGYGHVLPRGLLREPASGLRRADLILITRAEHATDGLLAELRRLNGVAPILRCRLAIKQFIDRDGQPIEADAIGAAIAVAGIGNPQALFDQLGPLGISPRETIAFPDHETYGPATFERINTLLRPGQTVVTTEKDWVKLARRPETAGWRLARAVLAVDFADGDSERLLTAVAKVIDCPPQK